MAKTTSLYIPQTVKTPGVSLANADGTNWKDLYTAGADGALVKALSVTSTDTATQVVQYGIYDGSTVRVIGASPVVANAGTDGTAPSVDLMDLAMSPQLAIDSNGKGFLHLQGTYKLQVKSTVAVTAAKTIDVVAAVEEY
jgi:hypothetical protein